MTIQTSIKVFQIAVRGITPIPTNDFRIEVEEKSLDAIAFEKKSIYRYIVTKKPINRRTN